MLGSSGSRKKSKKMAGAKSMGQKRLRRPEYLEPKAVVAVSSDDEDIESGSDGGDVEDPGRIALELMMRERADADNRSVPK